MSEPTFDDLIKLDKIKEIVETRKLWNCTCFGWHMIVEADNKTEAKKIGNRNVDSFGGIVGVDRCNVKKATFDDVADYFAMNGTL